MSGARDDEIGGADDLAATRRRAWLGAILSGALAVRLFRIDWGLPGFVFEDSRIHFAKPALRAVATGDWTLDFFFHPPLYPYFLTVVTWVCAALTGRELQLTGPASREDLAWVVLVGRIVTVVLAVAIVAVLYLVGRRLLGARAALWAAAFFAFAPLHVLESHRINVDTPMLLLALLSTHQSVIARQNGRRANLLWSFALAAAAGATKYTGLFIGTLPLWVALRWPRSSWRNRVWLIVCGAAVSAVSFALCISPILQDLDKFVHNVAGLFYIGMFQGAPGQDLVGASWVYAPYLYMTFVGLPFVLGWTVFAAAVAGVPVLALRHRAAASLIAAAAVPFFLAQGATETATARYYLPLAPFLALAAAAFVTWLRGLSRRAGVAMGAIVLGYTVALTGSQIARIGGANQKAVGSTLELLADAKRNLGISLRAVDQPKLVVAYPSHPHLLYDALRPYVRSSRARKLIHFPPSLRFPGEALAPREALRADRAWVRSHGVDVVVVTSRWEDLGARRSFRPRERQFYENLTGNRLGFRPAVREETSYLTQSWYEWADPTLDTLWTAGIGGYQLYVRHDLMPAFTIPRNRDS